MRVLDPRLLTIYAVAGISAVALTGACHGTTMDDGPTCFDCIEPQPPNLNQTVVTSSVAPPPISGGTLYITRDGKRAVVSDPDRDRVAVVDLASHVVNGWFWTERGAEPGRAVDDGSGRAYVVLRTTGQIATVDLATGNQTASTAACPSPRGIAYEEAQHRLHVACAGGELVTFKVGRFLEVERKVMLERDLRDVVVQGDKLHVSHFRSAKVDIVDAKGVIARQERPFDYSVNNQNFSPTVAWRMISLSDGRSVVIHQQSKNDPILVPDSAKLPDGSSTTSGGGPLGGGSAYGGIDCSSGIVHSHVTVLDTDGHASSPGGGGLASMPVPVDIAAFGARVAIVAAGNGHVLEGDIDAITSQDGCQFNEPFAVDVPRDQPAADMGNGERILPSSSDPIAVAYDPTGRLVVQIRQPSMLEIHDAATGAISEIVPLDGANRLDTGHQLFHSNPEDRSNTVLACASCHPEGRDDGHVWNFVDVGPRRTQSLSSFSPDTAPFHWGGDLADVAAVMDEVFVGRMGGSPQSPERKAAIQGWLSAMPAAPRGEVDAASAKRGEALFADPSVGCATCHSGPLFTNNVTVSVNTGAPLQVPGLRGVGARAPFMHDGCAPTLRDRFTNTTCGGGDAHGHTSQLSSPQIDDLVAYLETL